MPTYEYACKACEQRLEVVQSFQDDPLTECPECKGELRKVFSAAGIIFKGSGWHIKDYGDKKKSSTSTTAAPTSGDSGSSDGSSSKDSGSSSDSSATKKDGPKPTGNVKTFDTSASKAGKPGTNAPKKPSKAASD